MTMPDPSLSSQLRAAMEWWELAGVDGDFTDDATDWLSDSGDHGVVDAASGGKNAKTKPQGLNQHQEPAPEPVKPTRADLLGPNPPADLDAFREWWLSAPGLDTIGPRGRVAPRGAANPELMVLVIDPEQGDRDILLSGPQGRLLSRIIAAMGVPQESVYFASALPRHTPMADTASLAASGMDEIMQFHVNLVNPRQVLALGAGIPPLLGHALTNDLSHLREINRKQSPIPLFVTEGLDAMMAMPRLKAKFWRRWNEWSVKE